MKTYKNIPDQELDTILLQGRTPEPRTNLSQNVWRLIRCTEPEPQKAWSISWMTQAAVYASALILVAGAMLMGQRVGHTRQALQSEVQIPVLQPQTLAGSYVTTNQGR